MQYDERVIINNLTNVPSFSSLTKLELKNVVFSNSIIPSSFFSPSLTEIRLSTMDLTEVPKEIENCPNLHMIYLGHNKLTQFPYHLKSLNKLKTLSLYNNTIQGIFTEEINDFQSLEELDIGVNKFKNYPNSLPKLTLLGVDNNDFDNSYFIFKDITNKYTDLITLSFVGNNLNIIPRSIKNLKNLERIYLSDNEIEVLPEEIYELTSLKIIKLYNNTMLNGKFGFMHNIEQCTLQKTELCFPGENICSNSDTYKKCTNEEINYTKMLQEKVNLREEEINKEIIDDNKSNESFFARNKLIIIAIAVAALLFVLFVIFFCYNKKNDKEPIYVKDENNATYAYNDNEKSRRIINELNLSNPDIKIQDDGINESSRNINIINVSQPNNAYIPNSNINNSSYDNISSNNVSQLSPQMNPQLINNDASTSMITQLSPQLSPQLNPQFINNGAGTSTVSQLNNASSSNIILITSPVMNPVVNNGNSLNKELDEERIRLQAKIQKEMLATEEKMINKKVQDMNNLVNENSSNTELDEERIKLQAKIQKEMLATEEMMINKKAKDNYKDDDNEQPPPYSQFY